MESNEEDIVEVPVDQPPPIDRSIAGEEIVEVPVDAAPEHYAASSNVAAKKEDLEEVPLTAEPPKEPSLVEREKNAFKDLFSGTVKTVTELPRAVYESVKEDVKDILPQDLLYEDIVGKGEAALDDLVDSGLHGLRKGWDKFAEGAGVIDRMVGTTASLALDPLFGNNFYKDALKRDKALNLGGDEQSPTPEARLFPVSFSQDILQSTIEKDLTKHGQYLQSSDSPLIKKLGEIEEGMAGGLGVVSTMALSAKLDPTMWLKFGELSEVGQVAEKAGELEKGIAAQVAAGQRSLVSAEVPIIGSTNLFPEVQRVVAPKVLNKVVQGLVKFESSRIGQSLRYILTDPGWGTVGKDGQELVFSEHLLRDQTAGVMRNAQRFTNTLGVDLENPEVRSALDSYFNNPSSYPEQSNRILPRQKAEDVYNYLNGELTQAKVEAAQAGLLIPEFTPKSGEEFSERYVPRGATLSKRQQMALKESLQDLSESEKILEGDKSRKVDLSFLEERSKLNREYINKKIMEKYGIENYFHDDPILAYGEKIEQIRRSTNQKKFLDRITAQFPESVNDWVKAQYAARETIKNARGPVDPMLYRIAYANLDDIRSIDPKVLRKLQPLSENNLNRMKMPGPVADFVEGLFRTDSPGRVKRALNSYNRAFKNAVFFQPGYHLRNFYESAIRGDNAGLSAAQMARGMRDVWFGPTSRESAEYLREYDALVGHDMGILTNPTQKGEAVESLSSLEKRRAQAKVFATKEMLESETPFTRLMSGLRNMAATMKEDGFTKTVKNIFQPSNLVDNPLYRFSHSINEYGEKGFRFSYYKALREKGYSPMDSAIKTSNQFLNYSLTRQTLKGAGAQLYAPFINYAVKNAEVVSHMLAQNPKNFLLYGPGGTLERAIHHWAGWDQGQIYRLRDMYGPWYGEHILGPVLPNGKTIEGQKDYIKKFLGKMLSYGQDEQEGEQVLLRLPTSYHGLRMLNPATLDDQASPLIKMAYAALNQDPFTGEDIVNNKSDIAGLEKFKAVGAQLVNPVLGGVIPQRLLDSARLVINDTWPKIRENMLNMGFDEDVAKVLFGDPENDRWRDKARKSLDTMKLLWMGTVTKPDLDVILRMRADMKSTKDQIDRIKIDTKTGKKGLSSSIERISGLRNRLFDRMDHLYTILDEYQVRSDAAQKALGISLDDYEMIPSSEIKITPMKGNLPEPPTPLDSEKEHVTRSLSDGIIEVPVDANPEILNNRKAPARQGINKNPPSGVNLNFLPSDGKVNKENRALRRHQ